MRDQNQMTTAQHFPLENLDGDAFIEMFCRMDCFVHIQGGGVLLRRFSVKVGLLQFPWWNFDNFPLQADVKT